MICICKESLDAALMPASDFDARRGSLNPELLQGQQNRKLRALQSGPLKSSNLEAAAEPGIGARGLV